MCVFVLSQTTLQPLRVKLSKLTVWFGEISKHSDNRDHDPKAGFLSLDKLEDSQP